MSASASHPPHPAPIFRVALTGGIASGKSAVAHEFARLGVPVIDTDQLAREVVAPGEPALAALIDAFGTDILNSVGELDRRAMRERVFADANARQTLERILHPAIRARQDQRSLQLGGVYQIHVVPLLVESSSHQRYQRVLVVDCPRELQLQRLLHRDQISPALAEQILNAQATRDQRLAIADEVIDNQAGLDALAATVATLHQNYLKLAQATGRQ